MQVDLDRRLAPVVEGAAYFVVCEALANAAKHAPGAPVEVTLTLRDDVLRARIRDEGPGGADPSGSGLTGLRHRVEALDGALHDHERARGHHDRRGAAVPVIR